MKAAADGSQRPFFLVTARRLRSGTTYVAVKALMVSAVCRVRLTVKKGAPANPFARGGWVGIRRRSR
jgi:hypothetical protein